MNNEAGAGNDLSPVSSNEQYSNTDMYRSFKMRMRKYMVLSAAAALMSLSAGMTAFAATKYVDIEVESDNIPEHNAGEAFMPEFELSSENDLDNISIQFENAPEATANPTVPFTYKLKIHADDSSLDEDLEIRATGARYAYVDYISPDNSDAEARLQVYPFYRLIAPTPTIDKTAKTASWSEVPYAGKYEYVITYTTKNGATKTVHGTTKQTHVSVASALSQDADGEIGFAVRALATDEDGYADATVNADGKAVWDSMDWANQYKLCISYTNTSGRTVKTYHTVTGTSYNVNSYISSSADKQVKVTVRGIPQSGDKAYYNIAVSEFGTTGGETAETGDYEVDDPWAFLADYSSVKNNNFAQNVRNSANTAGNANGPTGTSDSNWKRVAYKWQYNVNGTPYNTGWLQIGGSWYYFDTDGYMHTGWLTDNGKRYYLESKVGSGQGVMVTGTREINGKSYTFDASGACVG